MKIKIIVMNICIGLSSIAFGQESFELSTGVVNGGTALIDLGNNDDTWMVSTPTNSSFAPAKCVVSLPPWVDDPNSRWISPAIDEWYKPQDNMPEGNYTYKTTFNISSTNTCSIANAIIKFNKLGGDNKVTSITINGYSHSLNAGLNPLATNLIVDIPGNELNPSGENTLLLNVYNLNFYTGLLVNGNIKINRFSPSFSLSTTYTPGASFFTCFATPSVGAALYNDNAYAWFVEEIVSATNTTVIANKTASNPSCWWNYSPYTCDFHGYDGSRTTVMDPACSNPTPGHFTTGHTYRITRGTWGPNCPWSQYSVIVYKAQGRGEDGIIVEEDKNAPDYSVLSKATSINETAASEKILSIFPNPNNGLFTITANQVSTGTIEIYDMTGRNVESIQLKNNITTYELNLTNYSKGIYLVNLISENKKYSEKISVE